MRKPNSSWLLTGCVMALLLGQTGCQSWSTLGYPFGNPSRVAPPPTGAYQVPSSYYNNVEGKVSQVQQGVDPLAANPSAMSGAGGNAIQPASFSAAGSAPGTDSSFRATQGSVHGVGTAGQSYVTGGGIAPAGGSASASFSDSSQEVPSLQWQQ